MNPYNRIMYWKWDAAIWEPGVLESKINDIFARASFDLVYVSLHHIHLPYHDPRIIETVDRCSRLLLDKGAKLVLDIEPRNEGASFFAKYPGSRALLSRSVEFDLDCSGSGSADIQFPVREHYGREAYSDPPVSVINAWAFFPLEGRLFAENSLTNIRLHTFMEDLEDRKIRFHVEGGAQNAGKRVLIYPAVTHAIPDPFSPAIYRHFTFMLDQVKDFPLGGIANDEWGYDLCAEYDQETGQLYATHFPYSPYLSGFYERRTGRRLEEDLLYFRYAPKENEGAAICAINDYVATLRAGMKENNDWFYAKGKALFGEDAFIGVHPTLWGDPADFNFDVLLNGLDWWEVKRDYGQTDEGVLVPTRLALAHKWGGAVWYNMFYSAFTLQLETYFKETWGNARYGGRTHYLGYECPNEGAVLELNKPGYMEKIAEMEQVVGKLNEFQRSQPDSRVLVIFGMEAVTNWRISDPGKDYWTPRSELMHRAARYAQSLLDGGYLCDFVPSSEIANGDVKLADGKAGYGTQAYDAIVYLYPEAMDRSVLSSLRDYTGAGGQVIVQGTCRFFNDGTDAAKEFGEWAGRLAFYHADPVEPSETIRILREWGVPGNVVNQGCVYQDGSVIFTAEGVQHRGNRLVVDAVVKGRRVEAECEDFLAIELAEDGSVVRLSGSNLDCLSVNGQKLDLPRQT